MVSSKQKKKNNMKLFQQIGDNKGLSSIYINNTGVLCYSDSRLTLRDVTPIRDSFLYPDMGVIVHVTTWTESRLSLYSSNLYYHNYLRRRFGVELGDYVDGMYSRCFYQATIMDLLRKIE